MTISLIPLPYAHEALEPVISARTLELHHGAHHKGYVDKLNAAIEGTGDAGMPLEDIVRSASGGTFNNAAQVYNHGFYWHSLSPSATQPGAELAKAIDEAFGSLDALKEQLTAEAVGHFASGWAWLVAQGGELKVVSTHDAETVITGGANPLLTIDVWEHAYYLDAQNKRPEYVKGVVGKLLNWQFASDNFARGAAWTYPG